MKRTWHANSSYGAYQSFIKKAEAKGFDKTEVQGFLSAINAHPELIAHAQVFENMTPMLGQITLWLGQIAQNPPQAPPVIHISPNDIKGKLTVELVRTWQQISDWAATHRDELKAEAALQDFDSPSTSASDHPINGTGIGRHGVVSALWNRHESCTAYPPDKTQIAAYRYFLLQTQLLFSYLFGRVRFVEIAEYESNDDPRERPIAPALSESVSRTIREWSFSKYDASLNNINPDCLPSDFAQKVQDVKLSDNNCDGLTQYLESYLLNFQRYFRRAGDVYKGNRPAIRKRRGSGGRGGSAAISGFVKFSETSLYEQEEASTAEEDADDVTSATQGIRTFYTHGEGQTFDALAAEEAGLAPHEDLEKCFLATKGQAFSKSLRSFQFQQMSMELGAQDFPWRWSHLTPGEVRKLWLALDDEYRRQLAIWLRDSDSTKSNNTSSFAKTCGDIASNNDSRLKQDHTQQKREQARLGVMQVLILRVMLLFGQPLTDALKLQRVICTDFKGFELTVDALHLLISGPESEPLLSFRSPALSPPYKTDDIPELVDLARSMANNLNLADVSGLATQIYEFDKFDRLDNTKKLTDKYFNVHEKTVKSSIVGLLRSLDERFTLNAISLVMPQAIDRLTGDQTQAWMCLNLRNYENEPRLYYTVHRTSKLESSYELAARTVVPVSHQTPNTTQPPNLESSRVLTHSVQFSSCESVNKTDSEEVTHIGCRFVIKRETLTEKIKDLKDRLKNIQVSNSKQGMLRYHEDYLLYTYLMLTLSTASRAIDNPVQPYLSWLQAQRPNRGLNVGLADKESVFFHKARLAYLPPELCQQFENFTRHLDYFIMNLYEAKGWRSRPEEDKYWVVLNGAGQLENMSAAWIKDRFEEIFEAPVPSNFSRAFLRTELLERGLETEFVDAFMGHASMGESPFGSHSTFNYGLYTRTIAKKISELLQELNLVPVTSRLIPN